ncbi:putative maleylacetate reductase [Periconia macrospinosa]|uniref:Putative maleylacetate reductase n=1 Tax=Periconia macrospinosa TaxID=97972 RepID=A0A2V1E086_9PLEO|nr:putative maleylacetate reductase [Periconia macrospinosa]
MESFVYTTSPSHVIFGPAGKSSSQLLNRLECREHHAVLILSTPGQAEKANVLAHALTPNTVGVFSKAAMHTPIEITREAVQAAEDLKADSIVSIGGGSTIGLGKAISIRTGLRHFCIPTTYAGSEMTPILGETVDGIKTTRRDIAIIPETVIYDVSLTMSLPLAISITSGINAIAHAVEALYAPDTNPIIRLMAKEGIGALSQALLIITASPQDLEARTKALYGAWLCGVCLGSTTMSLHHKLCHTLGGSFNLPHAETHAILLPHTFAYNSPAVPSAARDLAYALGDAEGDAVKALNSLLDRLSVSRALSNYGLREEDLGRAASIAVRNPYGNPRKVEEGKIQELIRRAWAGEHAKADL